MHRDFLWLSTTPFEAWRAIDHRTFQHANGRRLVFDRVSVKPYVKVFFNQSLLGVFLPQQNDLLKDFINRLDFGRVLTAQIALEDFLGENAPPSWYRYDLDSQILYQETHALSVRWPDGLQARLRACLGMLIPHDHDRLYFQTRAFVVHVPLSRHDRLERRALLQDALAMLGGD